MQCMCNICTILDCRTHRCICFWVRPGHLATHTEVLGFATVFHLVAEPRTDYQRHTTGQALCEAVLATMRQEDLDPLFQDIHLGKRWCRKAVDWQLQAIQRIGLRAQSQQQQRTLLWRAAAESIDGTSPSTLTQLSAREATLDTGTARIAGTPTPRTVSCDDPTHAHQHKRPAHHAGSTNRCHDLGVCARRV